MNPRVKEVKPSEDYRLEITFMNGEKKIFDMKPYLKTGQFRQLEDKALFASVKPVMGSVQWQNGLDLCPDTLYEESTPYEKEQKLKSGSK